MSAPLRRLTSQACLLAIFAAILTFAIQLPAAAQEPAPPAHDQSDTAPEPPALNGAHVEGHIAFLHAELGITPAQESVWAPVADAMRQDVAEMDNAEQQVGQQGNGRESAIQYLQNRVTFACLRAQGEERFLAAFQPLYDQMSNKQKEKADDLLVPTDSEN